MKQLIDELNIIDWSDPQWMDAAADVLQAAPDLPYSLASCIRGWNNREKAAKFNGSHVTGTHYKLLIYREHEMRFTLWMHDYKPAAERGLGYAEVPHNHRYNLCSIILRGGYDSILYEVSPGIGETIVPKETSTFRPGDTLSLAHDQVHSLTEIHEGTQTLFIEGPVLSNFSTAYPPVGPPQRYFDFYGLERGFMSRLESGS